MNLNPNNSLEVTIGFEPMNRGFAVCYFSSRAVFIELYERPNFIDIFLRLALVSQTILPYPTPLY